MFAFGLVLKIHAREWRCASGETDVGTNSSEIDVSKRFGGV
jgi:hypothetical protein